MTRYARIVGWGKFLPPKVLTNFDLERMVDTSDEWIRTRTGIRERHMVNDPNIASSDLAVEAAKRALSVADMTAGDIDLIMVATSTPDHLFPATACIVQDKLGATQAGAFDVSAACSGFIYGLALARGLIASGEIDTILLIGTEVLSRFVDWNDRETCVLFGDGAGAVVIKASEERGGVMASMLGADGSGASLLGLPMGGSRLPPSVDGIAEGENHIKMKGRPIFRFAVHVMAESSRVVMEKMGWAPEDVDLVVPHQANERIIRAAMKQLKIPMEKAYLNIATHGNTSTASVPMVLVDAINEGRIKQGSKLVLTGFGAGLTYAAVAIEWGARTPAPEAPIHRNILRKIGYNLAHVRSAMRRAVRAFYGFLLGPEEGGGWRVPIRQKFDEWLGLRGKEK